MDFKMPLIFHVDALEGGVVGLAGEVPAVVDNPGLEGQTALCYPVIIGL